MRDDLGQRIDSQLGAEDEREPDLSWVVARGRRLRTLRRAAVAAGTAALIAAGSVAVVALPTDRPLPLPVVGDATPPVDGATGPGMVEDMTEQEQAEIFAFRALAHTGLMNPFSARTYNWTYADDTTGAGDFWRVGFAASDCAPRENTFTCRGLSGEEDENGNPIADTFLLVVLSENRWTVGGVDGSMPGEDRDKILGYSLPQREEPSHWEFPAVGVWPINDEYSIEMVALWVGPYPTSAPGSFCQLRISDSDDKPAVGDRVFYQEPPNRPFERGGWIRGIGGGKYADAERAEVDCRQYTGGGWEIVGEPELVGEPGAVRGVTAELEWRGDEGFTAPAVCDATLLDEEGNEVWDGSGRVEALWRESELREYPYEATVFVQDRGRIVTDAAEIGEFVCRTR